MRRVLIRVALVSALSAWMGCGGPQCPAGTLPKPEVLTAAASRDDGLRSLRAEAAVDQTGPDGRIKGQVLMFMERPDRVRFDAMTQFGPMAILTSDGESFALTDLKEKRFLEGPACPRNIARMLGVELSAAEVLGLLLGELPGELPEASETACREGEVSVRRALPQGGAMITGFEVDAEGSATLRSVRRLAADDSALWSVRYEGRIASGAASVPRIVELTDHRNDTELRVRFKQVDVNVDVPDGVFQQTARPGLAPEQVPCQ